VHQVFLGTSAINEFDSEYWNDYHGNYEDPNFPSTSFVRGAWMIPYDDDDADTTVEALIKFTCTEDNLGDSGLLGCQMVDTFGKCFGYALEEGETGNFGVAKDEIRLQWQECIVFNDDVDGTGVSNLVEL
jgi:hypothetical protein